MGMLRSLIIDQGLDFQIIRGVSVGSLNAAVLAQAPMGSDDGESQRNLVAQVVTLERIWCGEVKGNSSIYAGRAGVPGFLLGADSLYSIRPLRKLIKQYVSEEALGRSGRDFTIGTVSLVSGKYEECGPGTPDFMERFIASSSIPVVFPPVSVKQPDDILVDGGVRSVTPLASVFHANPPADEIYVLLASRLVPDEDGKVASGAEVHRFDQWDDNFLGTEVNGLDILMRTVDLLTDEVYLGDIRNALDWNEMAKAVEVTLREAADDVSEHLVSALRSVGKRNVPLNVLAPNEWFDPGAEVGKRNSATEFHPELTENAMKHGACIARDRSKWLVDAESERRVSF